MDDSDLIVIDICGVLFMARFTHVAALSRSGCGDTSIGAGASLRLRAI
jgi:hypothetical protein